MSDERSGRTTAAAEGLRLLRIGACEVACSGPADALARGLGPLEALEVAAGRDPARSGRIALRVRWTDAARPARTGARSAATPTSYDASGPAPALLAPDLGTAVLELDGRLEIALHRDAPEGDAVAERLTIPALAERMRRERVRLVHAAVLLAPDKTSAVLVPAARGGGKTTLSLSLRRHGWTLLSDDRGWLGGDADGAWIDPWTEAPRVGDRSLFLLPPGILAGPRDARTGKAVVPGLTPPRLDEPVAVRAVAFPRLVPGRGGGFRAARGVAALAPLLSQCVVATDPAAAAATLRFVADLLACVPRLEVEIGDDPAMLAPAAAALAASARQGP